jgi:hypothetical protein
MDLDALMAHASLSRATETAYASLAKTPSTVLLTVKLLQHHLARRAQKRLPVTGIP